MISEWEPEEKEKEERRGREKAFKSLVDRNSEIQIINFHLFTFSFRNLLHYSSSFLLLPTSMVFPSSPPVRPKAPRRIYML